MVSRTEMEMERLIGRCLDGEASEQEQLELQREMLRNPDVHRMFDESQRIDELAGSTLREALSELRPSSCDTGSLGTATETATRTDRTGARGGWRIPPLWLFVPGAIAAAILALIIPSPMGRVIEHRTAEQAHSQQLTGPLVQLPAGSLPGPRGMAPSPARLMPDGMQPSDGLMRNVGLSTPQIKRKSGRDVLGIVGDDGNIYWIEIDRTRTFRGRLPSSEPSSISETF